MLRSTSVQEDLINLLADCYDDPDLFNTAWLGRPPYWWRQVEMCQSVIDYRCTAVYSGNSIGKDYWIGGMVPWWLATRENSLVIVTGPTQTVLGSVTWKEIRRAVYGSLFEAVFKPKISSGLTTSPAVVEVRPGWQALGYSTTSVERASGQHARDLLVIVEEASGVEDEIWDAIESLKYSKLIAIGNPIRAEGRFVDLIHQAETDQADGVPPWKAVHAIQVPSTDSPDAENDESEWGLADRTWLEASYRRYGENSLWVRSHIKALIPELSAEALIPTAWLDYATHVERPQYSPVHPIHRTRRIGVDLGEGVGRDDTAIVVRDDYGILECFAGNALALGDAAFKIAQLAKTYNIDHSRISYDKLGIGRDFGNHLVRHGIRDAVPYAGSGPPRHGKAFTNLRTEAAWNLRRRLDPERHTDDRYPQSSRQPPFHIPIGPWWPLMREDLEAMTYDLVGNKTRLIKKEDLLDRLGRSPDRGDALIQTFAFI